MNHFIEFSDFNQAEIYSILDRADILQKKWLSNRMPKSLKSKKIALWFFGQGFRNRMAFEIGARSMGADISFVPGELGVQEPLDDIMHYLNNWFSMLVIRCKSHDQLNKLVADAKIPVINARTSYNHPCEIMGDLQFIRKRRKSLEGLNVVFVGEVTNLCMSWFEAAKVLPIRVMQIAPKEYLLNYEVVEEFNRNSVGSICVSENFDNNINQNVEVLYTDCWPHSENKDSIQSLFSPYRITADIVKKINPNGFFMPCPPVTRGEEVTPDSLESEKFCDFEAKEYLLHSQNAIMEYCFV